MQKEFDVLCFVSTFTKTTTTAVQQQVALRTRKSWEKSVQLTLRAYGGGNKAFTS